MAKPRLFSTSSLGAMSDPELTGLDWRVYLWVSLHDGMSLAKGKGAGCFASNNTLFAEARCDYASGCRALSKLVKRGHLVREKIGRATSYRVTFPTPDMLQTGNLSSPRHVAASPDDAAGYVAEFNLQDVDNEQEPDGHYSPLSGELYSVETEELNSSEEARAYAPMADEDGAALFYRIGKAGAEAPAASGVSIDRQLSPHFAKLDPRAQLVRFEEAFAAIDRDADALDSRERDRWASWLWALTDDYAGETTGHQAQRLLEELGSY